MAKGKQGGPMTPEKHERLKRQGFQKGQSGNPKGRPPIPQEIKDAMAHRTPDAIRVLEDVMLNGANEAARVKAAEYFLGPFVSKAAQKVDVDVKHSVVGEFLANANKRRAELQQAAQLVIDAQPEDVKEVPKDGDE